MTSQQNNQNRIKVLFQEISRREELKKDLRSILFDKQLAFIDDKSKLKAAQCDRRAGKSYTVGADFILDAFDRPRTSQLYITKTTTIAKRILWKDVLQALNNKFQLGMQFNSKDCCATYSNGGILYTLGTDTSPDEADKMLGQRYSKVHLDESAHMKQDQRYLVYEVLLPATADLDGQIALNGSCGNKTNTLFYDITGRDKLDPRKEPGWSVHKWSWRDNPMMRDKMANMIALLLEQNPKLEITPGFRQMYCNEWVVDAAKLVYRFDESKNAIKALPLEHEYYYTLSVDLGFDNPTAFTVAAYSKTDPCMYFVFAMKRAGMDITDVAHLTNELNARYKFVKFVIDGADKQSVKELQRRFRIPFIPVDKRGKEEIIEIMNADFLMGNIKIIPDQCPDLITEYKNLIWDEDAGRRVEDPTCQNDLADSGLYNWRECYHYLAREPERAPAANTDEFMDQYWAKEELKLQRSRVRGWMEKDFPEWRQIN